MNESVPSMQQPAPGLTGAPGRPPAAAAIGAGGSAVPSRAIPPDLLAALRRASPATAHHVHFNHASASLQPETVAEAVELFVRAEGRTGAHAALADHREELDDARCAVADLIGAAPANIAFVGTATHAWGLALSAAVAGGARHLTSVRNEWGPNLLNAFRERRDHGLAVRVTEPDRLGRLDPGRYEDAHVPGGILAAPLVPTSSGMVNPVEDLAAVARARDALLFVDAAQAVGQMPVDVLFLGADVLVFPSRKWLRGPKGVAVLFASDRALARMGTPALVDQVGVKWDRDDDFSTNADASRFESFEHSPAARLGLREAARVAAGVGLDCIQSRIRDLTGYLVASFDAAGLPRPLEDTAGATSGILTFTAPLLDAREVARDLHARGTFVAAIGRNYARLALADRGGVEAILRVSVHYINTEQEVDRLIEQVAPFLRWRAG